MAGTHVAQALVAPRKYVQGRGLLSSVGSYVAVLGRDTLVIADGTVTIAADAYARAFPGSAAAA